MRMRMYDIIEKKKEGKQLTSEEITFFIKGYCNGTIPDYQASALLMAIFLKGMTAEETAELTYAMAYSGEVVDLSAIKGIKVDKHSTGGVGDKTTLVLAPIAASCGVPVAKMSGRGLGHTGGTIDKLESIPGFRTDLSGDEFIENVKRIGIAVAGQTGNLAPADKKLYALRDVTATVDNIPLIASSIMSKKIAAGADKIVLDVKTGSGAFMKTLDQSLQLAAAMVDIGNRVGRETVAYVTEMDIPLGNAIGNSLEVIEAIAALKGNGPSDLTEVSLELAAKMLELCGMGSNEECRRKASNAINDGKAFSKLVELVRSQGGEETYITGETDFPRAALVYEVLSPQNGYIAHMITDRLGKASMVLGAGRETKESSIDYTAGILLLKKTGEYVQKGERIALFHTSSMEKALNAESIFLGSIAFSPTKPESKPLIRAFVDKNGARVYTGRLR